MKQAKLDPSKPGMLGKVRWKAVKTFMRTIGRTSNGVDLGYNCGFNSGPMLDYIYLNKPQGRWVVGKYLDKTYLNAIGWRAIRNRRDLVQQTLRDEFEQFRSKGETIRLLDVAAGPGRYLQELLNENPANLRVLCRDLDGEGLNQGRLEASKAGLDNIHFETGDALSPAPTSLLDGPPNFLVVSGLYEQISDDPTVIKSLQTFFNFLAPGGTILLTTQVQHPQLDFVFNVMTSYTGEPWLLKCRPIEKIEQWLGEAGFSQIKSRVEKEGLCAVTTACK